MNKTIFFTLWALLISSTSAIADSALPGKWKQTDIFCEGSESLMKPTKIQMVINKTSMTKITDLSRAMGITNCLLLTSTNYSIINDQFTIGPFLELTSPNCPKVSQYLRQEIKMMEAGYVNKDTPTEMVNFLNLVKLIKEGKSTKEYKISDDHQILRTYGHTKDCPEGIRLVYEYERM